MVLAGRMAASPILSHSAPEMQPGGQVLVAPDAFKGSLSALAAAEAMAEGARRALPSWSVRILPIADGGAGSVDALVRAGYSPYDFPAHGPTGAGAAGRLAMLRSTAVVEVANTCGLALLPRHEPDPTGSSTVGLGQAVLAALDLGASDIVLCLGGSASTDGGAGLLVALGARLLGDEGEPVAPSGAALASVRRLDLSGLDERLARTRFTVATDVSSPLLGPSGAAAVFAPQKGADPATVAALEVGLGVWARVLAEATGHDFSDVPGAGAAGGAAVAALAALGADPRSGAAYVEDAIELSSAISEADLVVTGEGRLDDQSLLGKGAVSVARLAHGCGVPVVMVCGSIHVPQEVLAEVGVVAHAALDVRGAPEDAMAHAAEWLADATASATSRATSSPRSSAMRPSARSMPYSTSSASV